MTEAERALWRCPQCKGNGRVEMLEHCPLCRGCGVINGSDILALLDEQDRLRAAMTSAIIDLQRGYHATAAAILRVALEPKP